MQWATDQDIANNIADIGVTDFQDVKFFENRANGQSKGFCVISLGSDQSIRMVLDRLPKKEIHGQHPVVTLPTKQVSGETFNKSRFYVLLFSKQNRQFRNTIDRYCYMKSDTLEKAYAFKLS